MCGEKWECAAGVNDDGGTSPRVWGKDTNMPIYINFRRNIPTCVGKSARRKNIAPEESEHPHVCGEKATAKAEAAATTGTSPRVWGKGFRKGLPQLQHRNIPTCVGKSQKLGQFHMFNSEHPHVCGEKACRLVICFAWDGTSPRVWGKVVGFRLSWQ